MAQAFAVIGTYPYRQAEPDDRSRGDEAELCIVIFSAPRLRNRWA
jgi:hypothetical protein